MNGKDSLEMEIEFINNSNQEFVLIGGEFECIRADIEVFEYLEGVE